MGIHSPVQAETVQRFEPSSDDRARAAADQARDNPTGRRDRANRGWSHSSGRLAKAVAGIVATDRRIWRRSVMDWVSRSIGQDSSATTAEHAVDLAPQRFDSGVVGDHQIGTAALVVARPLGLFASLERLRATSRAATFHARSRSSRGASTNTIRSHRSSQPASSKIAASSTTSRPRSPPPAPLAIDRLDKPGAHPRVKDRLQVVPCRGIGKDDRTQRLADRWPPVTPARRRFRPAHPPQTARRSDRARRDRSSSSCPTESASITTAPRSFKSAATSLFPPPIPPVRPDHRQRAMPEAPAARLSSWLVWNHRAGSSLASEARPRNRISRGIELESSRAKLRSSRDPSGRMLACRRECDHMICRPVNHRGRCRWVTLGPKDVAGGAKRDSRNVVNWLNQVGFLKVSQPSSLIQGFSKHRRNRGRGGQA